MYTVSVSVPFCYAHRVLGHPKCKHLHGHNGMAEVVLGCPGLPADGMVVDFGVAKSLIKNWVDQYWDHHTILDRRDKSLINFLSTDSTDRTPYITDQPPTAEVLAHELYEAVRAMFQNYYCQVVSVTVTETPNCSATYKEGSL